MRPVQDQARRYDKPWLQGLNKENQNKKENASEFLHHIYPDGIGPDTELINMLERDVIQKNPSVQFDDISELDDAKKTL